MEPTVEALGGIHPGAVARRYLLATRPKFLTASVLPVLLGTAIGAQATGSLDVWAFAFALGAVICVHAAANVLNDVYDDLTGNDGANDNRIYPYTGGSRFIQNGVIERSAMAKFGVALLVVGAAFGAALTLLKGGAVIGLGAMGAALGILYSAPPVRLSARGLGELTVAIAFGVLPVVGAAWLQSGQVDVAVVIASLPTALWIANVLIVNEVPDRVADAAVARGTLVVRLGLRGAARLYVAISVMAVCGAAGASWLGAVPPWAVAVPIGLSLVGVSVGRAIRVGEDDRDGLVKGIERTLMIHALGTLWLTAIVVFGG